MLWGPKKLFCVYCQEKVGTFYFTLSALRITFENDLSKAEINKIQI